MTTRKQWRRNIVPLMGTLLIGALTACGDPLGASHTGIKVISGPQRTDTAMAILQQPFVLEVRDSRGGYETPNSVSVRSAHQHGATISAEPGGPGSDWQILPLSSEGRVTFWVRLGSTAGAASIVIQAFDVSYTLDLTVTPGRPAIIVSSPADTAVYVDHSYAIDAEVTDQWGNVRSERPVLVGGTSAVSLENTTVSGRSIGRSYVLARLGDVTDTAWVSVVPRGTLTVYQRSLRFPYDTAALVSLGLDGSDLRRILYTNEQYSEADITFSWSPDGTALVYYDIDNPSGSLLSLYMKQAGQISRLPENPAIVGQTHPVFSPDGQWIYYTGSPIGLEYSLWRMRPDGSETTQVTPTETSYLISPKASLNPDGSKLVYGVNPYGYRIKIVDLQTGQRRELSVQDGIAPQWAPNADLIAFTTSTGELHVVRSDGTGERTVSPRSRRYSPGVRWSPDGRYLIAAGVETGVLELVDVETGESLPLAFSGRMRAPCWTP